MLNTFNNIFVGIVILTPMGNWCGSQLACLIIGPKITFLMQGYYCRQHYVPRVNYPKT